MNLPFHLNCFQPNFKKSQNFLLEETVEYEIQIPSTRGQYTTIYSCLTGLEIKTFKMKCCTRGTSLSDWIYHVTTTFIDTFITTVWFNHSELEHRRACVRTHAHTRIHTHRKKVERLRCNIGHGSVGLLWR